MRQKQSSFCQNFKLSLTLVQVADTAHMSIYQLYSLCTFTSPPFTQVWKNKITRVRGIYLGLNSYSGRRMCVCVD